MACSCIHNANPPRPCRVRDSKFRKPHLPRWHFIGSGVLSLARAPAIGIDWHACLHWRRIIRLFGIIVSASYGCNDSDVTLRPGWQDSRSIFLNSSPSQAGHTGSSPGNLVAGHRAPCSFEGRSPWRPWIRPSRPGFRARQAEVVRGHVLLLGCVLFCANIIFSKFKKGKYANFLKAMQSLRRYVEAEKTNGR